MATIREITSEFQQLLEMAEEQGIDQQVIADTLGGISGEFEDKADGYAKVIDSLTDEVCAIDRESKRLAGKKTVLNNNIANLKKSLEEAMRATGKHKFKTDLYSYNIQKNPTSVHILNEEKIPKQYRIPQPDRVDKKALKDFMKENGNTEFAELTQTEGLRIR